MLFLVFASFVGESALEALRDYWRVYQPRDWLFPGAEPGRHLSPRSIQAVFGRARETAGVHKQATVHTLRHSFATQLLEDSILRIPISFDSYLI